jgi:hypothetical protein
MKRVVLEGARGMTASRLRAAALLGAVLAVAAVGPALAADPSLPPDVVFDATVMVLFVTDDGPVDQAEVELTATRDGVILATATAQTDPAGTATMTGLPRSTAGAPVLLDITASRIDPRVDHGNGCWEAESWSGTAHDVVSDVNVQVQLLPDHSSSPFCPPPPTVPPADPEPTQSPATPTLAQPSSAPQLTLPPTDSASGPATPDTAPFGPGMVLIGGIASVFLLLGVRRATR